jgi:hypothetical protein
MANKHRAANLLSMSYSHQNSLHSIDFKGDSWLALTLNLFLTLPGDIWLESTFALLQRDPFGNSKSNRQTEHGTYGGVAVALSGLRPNIAESRAYYQQSQRHQVYQAYPAHHRAFGNRHDDFITDAGIDRIIHLKLTRFAAKQPGQFARPAALAGTLLAAICLIRLNQGMLPVYLDNYGACLKHAHLPLKRTESKTCITVRGGTSPTTVTK